MVRRTVKLVGSGIDDADLLFAPGMRVAMLDLKPWYQGRSAKVIGPASDRATKAITERAITKAAARGTFGPSV